MHGEILQNFTQNYKGEKEVFAKFCFVQCSGFLGFLSIRRQKNVLPVPGPPKSGRLVGTFLKISVWWVVAKITPKTQNF